MERVRISQKIGDIKKFKSRNLLIVICFWIAGLNTARNFRIEVFPDSGGYLIGNSVSEWGNLSFLGESVRAWPTLMFYSFSNSLESKAFLQSILYLSAVTLFLGSTVAFKKSVKSSIATILICCLFLSNNVFQWNATILAESSTLSFVLIGFASFFQSIKINLGVFFDN